MEKVYQPQTVRVLSEWTRLLASGAVLLPGFHAVKHALRFGATLPLVVTADRELALSLAAELADDVAAELAGRLHEVDAATFARLTGSAHHTGVAALALRPTVGSVPVSRRSPVVFLDDPRHLGNFGAVIRVAAGLGAAGVVATGTVDPWHPTVVRGAAGLQFALPVWRIDSPDALPAGPLVAFDGSGSPAGGFAVADDAVLAFGSERRGLSDRVLDRADAVLALPMRPGVASYNLASAVAMALYQWVLGSGRASPGAVPPGQADPGHHDDQGGQ